MFLIVGLGNPGAQYEHTRHNVGFDVLTILSQRLNISINRLRNSALVGEGQFEGEKVALCKPQTYMNLSGEAVQQLLRWYKLPPERLLVIYDDIDLAPGWLRIRKDGSAGTHNGMRNIVTCIGTEAFARIRVGIGGKPDAYELADWVLSHYNTPDERKGAFDAYNLAADAAIEWMRNGVTSAISLYNTKKTKPLREKPLRTETHEGVSLANAVVKQPSATLPSVNNQMQTERPSATDLPAAVDYNAENSSVAERSVASSHLSPADPTGAIE